MNKGYYHNTDKNKPFPIQRWRESELDEAIKGLEARGYECIRRGSDETERKDFDYRENKGQKFKFSGTEVHQKCWAVMKRKTPYVKEVEEG